MNVFSQRASAILLLLLTGVVAVAFSLLPRIPQPQAYHLFADQRSFLGIPNFGDVVSNVAFGVIGILGLLFLLSSKLRGVDGAFSRLARTMALHAGFHWLVPDSIWLVLLSLVSEQCATDMGSAADDDRIHGDGGCNHCGAN